MESQSALKLEVAALSDVGRKRTNNEDSFGYDLAARIFVICDGMGGLAAGEVASSTAVSEVLRSFTRIPDGLCSYEQRLRNSIIHANREVYALSRSDEKLRGMGTTLVSCCVEGRKLVVGNVGDSRAYFLRGGECAQITLDHSYVAEQVRKGVMTVTEAEASPLKSLVTRSIGTAEQVEPDVFTAEVEDEDMLLLCSDGLTRYIDSDGIAERVSANSSLESACRTLINVALERGAVDNVTCLLVRFQG